MTFKSHKKDQIEASLLKINIQGQYQIQGAFIEAKAIVYSILEVSSDKMTFQGQLCL